jgi:hypothetical protein
MPQLNRAGLAEGCHFRCSVECAVELHPEPYTDKIKTIGLPINRHLDMETSTYYVSMKDLCPGGKR